MDTTTHSAPENNAGKNVTMAVLSYIGILVIISFLTSKDDPFVKFHIKQGLVLLTIEVATWILGTFLFILMPLFYVINIITIILSIIGIVNAVKGREKILPITGKYASKFTF